MTSSFDVTARKVADQLPSGPRVGVLGSTSFWNPESDEICRGLGACLASCESLALVTGGMPGVGETVARAFHARRVAEERHPAVYHLLPEGFPPGDYGTTLVAGENMFERREILGRVVPVYVVIEGGPGTEHEAQVAMAAGATVIPVGRTGGAAADLYTRMGRPWNVDLTDWRLLRLATASCRAVIDAAGRAVASCLLSNLVLIAAVLVLTATRAAAAGPRDDYNPPGLAFPDSATGLLVFHDRVGRVS